MVIYLIGNEKKYPLNREEELVRQGCSKYRKNLEYMLTSEKVPELEEMDRKCRRIMKKMDLHYTAFQRKDYETVYQLWRDRIDRYSVKDMLESRIDQIEEKEECIIIRDKAGSIVGACVFEVNGVVGFSENIATIESCNGIGIGEFCLRAAFWIFFPGDVKRTPCGYGKIMWSQGE